MEEYSLFAFSIEKLPSRKKRTYSSSSEDDARVAKDKNTKRKSHYGKETDDRKQRNKTHKPVESGLSSDGDDSEEYVKRKTKTLDDRGRAKKMSSRKDKVKSKCSDSDSDDEKLSTSKKEKKKAPPKYSDSESDSPLNIAKSKKELKQRDYSSSDEDIRRREKSKSRKSTDSKRNKSYDDSDAEEYADVSETLLCEISLDCKRVLQPILVVTVAGVYLSLFTIVPWGIFYLWVARLHSRNMQSLRSIWYSFLMNELLLTKCGDI